MIVRKTLNLKTPLLFPLATKRLLGLTCCATAMSLALAEDARAQQPPRPGNRQITLPGARPARPAAAAAAPTPEPAPAQAPAPGATPEPEPPGAKGPLPDSMDAIAKAADVPYRPKPAGHLVKFNLQDADLAELVNHISGLTGRRFIYGPKVRQIKATVVSPQPVTLAEAYQAFLSILEQNGMTVVPHGRFLKIVDSGGIATLPTPVYSRGAPIPEDDRFITRLYRLEHISAEEATALLIKFKGKDGDLSLYGPGRLLIITDTGANIRRMVRIIEEVDIGGAGQRMWIEPVQYGSASEMAKRINELFELGAPGQPGQPGQPPGGGMRGGLSKVLADEQSNSLIVVGTEDSYLRLLELLKRLDAQPTAEGRIRVLALQHASAEELANTLTQMLSGQGRPPPGQPPGPGGGNAAGMFEGEVRVTPDKSTNSLLITSSARDFAAMRLVILKLDMARRQVFLEAVIMDLSVSDRLNLGTSWHAGARPDLGGPEPTLLAGGLNAQNSVGFPLSPDLLQGFAVGARGPGLTGTENLLGTGVSIPAFGVVLNALTTTG
ncbi:MAG TPA: secretin N-terminal domain-containing protein, partial [Polyangiaceae bacterium]